jgi:hypothetical protein
MILASVLLMVLATLAASERTPGRFALALSGVLAGAAIVLLMVGDLERALLVTAVLAAGLISASMVKHHHSGIKLVAADYQLLFAGTLPFLIAQYRRAAVLVLLGTALLVAALLATVALAAGPTIPLWLRFLLVPSGLGVYFLAYRAHEPGHDYRGSIMERHSYVSTFVASLGDTRSWRPSRSLRMMDVALTSPLPLLPARHARSHVRPDILVIQHESVFDPRTFGLPVDSTVDAFLSPPGSVCGRLNVDIYGGGSWQSEFSLLTGLSSATFGADAYFLFQKGIDRFQSSLPRSLSDHGYKTTLLSSCRRQFLSYDSFYRSIGVVQRIFSDDLPPPFDVDHFEKTHSDAVFLDAASRVLRSQIECDPAPQFFYLLTNFNHGPHSRRLVPQVRFERERAFATASLPDDQYIEYYLRLSETAQAWRKLREDLINRFRHRPMLVVHYGDHQPVLTRRIERSLKLPDDQRRQFQTFYAIEALNFTLDPAATGRHPVLDIAFLGTVALQIAGVPLDSISATRASLIDECGAAYFLAPSERKKRFHRTLVDHGLIRLDESSLPSRAGVAEGSPCPRPAD